jgi:hypothetical protein
LAQTVAKKQQSLKATSKSEVSAYFAAGAKTDYLSIQFQKDLFV